MYLGDCISCSSQSTPENHTKLNCLKICSGSVFGIKTRLLNHWTVRFSCCIGIICSLQSPCTPQHIACTPTAHVQLTGSHSWDTWMLQSEVHWEPDKEGKVDLAHLKSLLNQCWTRECSSVSHMPPCVIQSADYLFCFRNESFSNQQAIIWIGMRWIPAADFSNL